MQSAADADKLPVLLPLVSLLLPESPAVCSAKESRGEGAEAGREEEEEMPTKSENPGEKKKPNK